MLASSEDAAPKGPGMVGGPRDMLLQHATYGWSQSGYERDALYVNRGGKFLDISGVSDIDSITDGRGPVYADFDDDGDADIFLPTIQRAAHLLFRNDVGSESRWIRLTLVGTESGRDAFGTVVRVKHSAGTQARVKSGGEGFLSQHDPRLLFGVGEDRQVESIEVRWPSGRVQRFGTQETNRSLRITEGSDLIEVIAEKRSNLRSEPPRRKASEPAVNLPPEGLRIAKGDRLPKLKVASLDTGAIDLRSRFRKSERTLINFWATWCRACASELARLEELQAALRRRGVQVLALSVDDGDAASLVQRYRARFGLTIPLALADESVRSAVWAEKNDRPVPVSVIVDRHGNVLDVFLGSTALMREVTRITAGDEPQEGKPIGNDR